LGQLFCIYLVLAMTKLIPYIVCIFVCHFAIQGYSQESPSSLFILDSLLEQTKRNYEQQTRKATAYAERNNLPLQFSDQDGSNLMLLIGVDDNGVPLYKASHNVGAALTTGVNLLHENGGLGLNLAGDGVAVAIWDEGGVSHDEYTGRILSSEGNPASHANHVTGTILASGINGLAKGMAPKAKAYTYDFNNDEVEMLQLAKPDQTGILLSNHSYGLVTGWRFSNNSWQWFGDPSVSTQEDYRFGFYSSNAALWDQIAFNAPYYLMVKSAGNDRNDVGNGTRPPDCNGGSGFDCISDVSTAKNILTVGASTKVTNYTGPSSVGMSTFSSWGPTDDGRIKPDIVAAGVSLFSTSTNNTYATLSGTSMAAPNATGSLILIQELYKNLHGGNFMKASTLKALAIHTAKEAGPTEGPDYKFGWGLLDVEAAAKLILKEDKQNIFIEEYSLSQDQTIYIPISPKANEKITATIVWTDPAGTPVAKMLDPTEIMLVNDLDLRLIDDANNVQFPWILNPALPDNPATIGDNIRDNVEKLEFSTPLPRPYRLAISHKGILRGGSQNFSLILQYTSINDSRNVYYWVGGSGVWTDPSKWSFTSGGPPAFQVPSINDRVFFDENSFSSTNQIVTIASDVSCGALTWLTNKTVDLNLNSNKLIISGNLTIATNSLRINSEGSILMTGNAASSNSISLGNSDLSKATLIFDGSSWVILDDGKIGGIQLNKGEVIARDKKIEMFNLRVDGEDFKKLDIRNTQLTGVDNLFLQKENLILLSSGSTIYFSSEKDAIAQLNDVIFSGRISSSHETLSVIGASGIYQAVFKGEVSLLDNINIDELELSGNADLKLAPGKTLSLKTLLINSSENNPVSISSLGPTSSTLSIEGYGKLCFDFLRIDNVNLVGEYIVNAGVNSNLISSTNWLQLPCEQVLFPKFESKFNCVESLVNFNDLSEGNISSRSWSFANAAKILDGDPMKPRVLFGSSGVKEISLTISNSTGSKTLTRSIELVSTNNVPTSTILVNGSNLIGSQVSFGYQWYKNGVEIPGAVSRIYNYMGEQGNYFLVTNDGVCNRSSTEFIITEVESEIEPFEGVIYPNPVESKLFINSSLLPAKIYIQDINGVLRNSMQMSSDSPFLELHWLGSGIYLITIDTGNKLIRKRLVVK
jgi:hypothetical protein